MENCRFYFPRRDELILWGKKFCCDYGAAAKDDDRDRKP